MGDGRTLQFLFDDLAGHGDRPAVIAMHDGGTETWSFAELAERARRLAGGLLARGVGRDEPVAVYAPNRPEWACAALAVVGIGARLVPLDDGMSEEHLASVLADSGARRVFTVTGNVEPLAAAARQRRLEVFLLDAEEDRAAGRSWRSLLAEPPGTLPAVGRDTVAALFFTSGTTGAPKGVPLTHGNLMTNLENLLDLGIVTSRDRVLLPLPLHHSYPFLVGMLTPLAAGAAMVLPAGLAGPQVLRALGEGGVTIIVGVPRLYEALLAAIRGRAEARGAVVAASFRALLAASVAVRRRLGRRIGRALFRRVHREIGPELRVLASGGARLKEEVAWALEGLGWEVLSGYGLVETTSVSTFNPRGAARLGSAGRPAPGVEVRIADPDEDGRGEVLIRGPTVFSGYSNNPEANREAFTGDGWFRTGDLGVMDGDGYLYIVGRVKEMIVLAGGKNVSPEEIEAAYSASPYIREMAVLEHGDALVGLVVPDVEALREADTRRFEELIQVTLHEVSQRLPRFKRISGYAITREPLPRNPLGKYRRHELPAIYERARRGVRAPAPELAAADRALLERPRAKKVWAWLNERFPDRTLTPDTSPQLDLGVDSLAWLNLALELEDRIGVSLSEEEIARIVTLRDLLELVEAAPEKREEAGVPHAIQGSRGGPEAAPAKSGPLAERDRWLAPPGPLLTGLGYAIYGLVWLLARVFFRLGVEGRARVPGDGPLVLAANHASDLDPLVLAAALPAGRLRRTWWGGDANRLFRTRTLRALARVGHVFPVDDRAPAASLDMAAGVLRRGHILVWFPEEWRSPTGEIQPFLPGVGRLVRESGAPALPVLIRGTFEALPRGRRLPRPARVRVVFGDPIAAAELERRGAGDDPHRRIAGALRDAVAALAGRSA